MVHILADNFASIISSIITTILTTIIILYFKNKNTKSLEFLKYLNHPVRMFDSFIMITIFSNITAIWLSLRLYLYGIVKFDSYVLAFFLNQITISLLVITTIKFHAEYLDDELKTLKQQILFLIIMVVLWIFQIRCQYLIFTFIPKNIENKVIKTIEFIAWFYIILLVARNYLKLYVTKNFKKIIVTTKDLEVYHSIEIKYFDEYIALYEIKNRTRIVIFKDQIKSIEYEYQKKTIKELT